MFYTVLVICSILVSIAGLVLSIVLSRSQQKRRFDHDTNAATARHPILANPIFIAYIGFHVVILAIILYTVAQTGL